ncbi:FRG domain-containing protein [Flavobacterium davisii]|uniref:FRG domain-containing protein n=1 Tax=Flavobacterium davisii TaxID=2906077 RepID=A0ABW8PLN9_9FLAO
MSEKIIKTIADFEKAISEIRYGRMPIIGEQYQELYRGQSKDSYELKSGISRYAITSEEIKDLENKILKDFKDLVNESEDTKRFIQLSIYDDDYQNEWRWLEQIQHYRLPTRLLDWTLDPKIALFFAVERNLQDSAQFWIFKSPLNWSYDDHFEYNPYSENLDIISNSSFYIDESYVDKIAEHRRGIQSGKFTVQDYTKSMTSLETQEDLQARMIKYIIPADSKKYFLDYLEEMNINEDTIYVKYDDVIENVVAKIKTKYNFK